MSFSDSAIIPAERRDLLDSLKPRLSVEDYFLRSGRTFRKSKFRLWSDRRIKSSLIEFGLKAAGIYERGVQNALRPLVRRIQLRFPSLPPAFDGFVVLHLSDFHIDEMNGLAEALIPLLTDLRPDLCVLTGDYRYEIYGPCDEVYRRMQKVIASISARHGIVGILGNHDSAAIALRLEEMGVRMLVNEATELRKQDESLWLVGLDDQFDYRCADLPRALDGIPKDSFKVLLAHDPELYRQAAQNEFQLYLCGHTHAGQIRLPLLGPVKKNAGVPRHMVQGHWRHDGMQGYTSWGAGCSTLPVRFNCPPEIALLELRRG